MAKLNIKSICNCTESYSLFMNPLLAFEEKIPILKSKGNRPLKMTFDDQLHSLIYFHLQSHDSARHLVQDLNEDEFAKQFIAPDGGISKSSFCEAINTRGLEQMYFVFNELLKEAQGTLDNAYSELGDLISIDGSLINAVLSMHWADYRKNSKKAKGHFGFNINQGIPTKIFLTKGNGAERPFVSQILKPGQTGVMDRGYQEHNSFDQLQEEGKHFVCRIKFSTKKNVIKENPINKDSNVFYDSIVTLGKAKNAQTKKPVRVVGYRVEGVDYFVATDRFDLNAENIALIYKLRWRIETFFKWWKQHLNVYHLIARSEYGLMVQLLAGLITYLLMSIYCKNKYNEGVSVKRIRKLRIDIKNELSGWGQNNKGVGSLFSRYIKEVISTNNNNISNAKT